VNVQNGNMYVAGQVAAELGTREGVLAGFADLAERGAIVQGFDLAGDFPEGVMGDPLPTSGGARRSAAVTLPSHRVCEG
jgi:hypothetical protein